MEFDCIVWGDFALFTRPEMKVERVSYDVITPSAARGVVEAIYWKPEIRWAIDRIHVLRPIRFTSQRRNEVGAKITRRRRGQGDESRPGNIGMYVEEERQQRAALLLRDVAYVIEAHFEIVGGEPNVAKHLDSFNRRARAGQCFTRPVPRDAGVRRRLRADRDATRTCPPSQLPPDQRGRDFGWMLHDIDFKNDRQPKFFHAVMRDGVIHVPPFDGQEVRG